MKRLIVAVALLLCAGAVMAADGPSLLTQPQVQELVPLKHSIQTVQDLSWTGLIEATAQQRAVDRYLGLAAKVAGRPVTLAELMAIDDAPEKLTALQKFAGFVTFVNILWVIAIIIGVLSACWLFGDAVKALLEMFMEIPRLFYELIFYAVSVGLIFYADKFRPGVGQYVALTGCLLFAGALSFTMSRAQKPSKRIGFIFFAILTGLYSWVAVMYTSPMIGFFAVIALMGAMGFSVLVGPLVVCIGFENEDSLGKATVVAFGLLITFVAITITGSQAFSVFKPGALWMGSFVGYLGLLIASSRWYQRNFPWPVMQVVTIIAGVAALFVGSVWHIPELQRIGGTFFAFYLLEKLGEIPVESMRGYAVLGLIGSSGLWWFCAVVKSNPEHWRQYLLF